MCTKVDGKGSQLFLDIPPTAWQQVPLKRVKKESSENVKILL